MTLFTVAVWTKANGGGDNLREPHVIVSDEMTHDKNAIAVFVSSYWQICQGKTPRCQATVSVLRLAYNQ